MSTWKQTIALLGAEQATREGRWEAARSLYEHVLAGDAQSQPAQRGSQHVQELQHLEASLLRLLQRGDEQCENLAYAEAQRLYTDALNQSSQAGFLKYHLALEYKAHQAGQLVAWQQRADELLQRAHTAATEAPDAQQRAALLDELAALAASLPDAPGSTAQMQRVQQARQPVEQQMDEQERMRRARAAYDAQDFAEAIRLADAAGEGAANRDMMRLRAYARDVHEREILPVIERAQAAFDAQRMADGFGALESLRERYPHNPTWRDCWCQTALSSGMQLFGEGYAALVDRQFAPARERFEQARQLFERVLQVASDHPAARRYRQAAAALHSITRLQQQAHEHRQARRYAEALSDLEKATSSIEQAQEDGHTHAALEAMISTTRQVVEAEQARLAEEQRLLTEGDLHLSEHRLDRAEQSFRAVLYLPLLEENRKLATAALQRVESEQQRFRAALEQGRAAADTAQAVEAFQAAYECFPTEPEIAGLLETALVTAGEEALARSQSREATHFFERALQLNSDNTRARQGLQHPTVSERVTITIESTYERLTQLASQGKLQAASLQEALETLERLQQETQAYPDLQARMSQAHSELQARHAKWQAYEQHHQEATRQRDAGNWQAAVAQLRQASEALGSEAFPALQQELARWQTAKETLQATHQRAHNLWEDASMAYDNAEDMGDFDLAEELLHELEGVIQQATAATRQAGASLPPDLRSLHEQSGVLQRRIRAVQQASRASAETTFATIRDQILEVRTIRQLGDDNTLAAIERDLIEQLRGKVPDLLRQASDRLESGSLEEADRLLEQVIELRDDFPAVADLQARIERYQRLEEVLERIEAEAEGQREANRPLPVLRTLRRGLQEILDFEAATPTQPEVVSILADLLHMGDMEDGLGIGYAEHWQAASRLLRSLKQLSTHSRVARRADALAHEWANLARDIAQRGLISSLAEVGRLLDAYRTATAYVARHERDQEAIEERRSLALRLISSYNESASNRLNDARRVFAAGDSAAALRYLESVEHEVYTPIEREFPLLLENTTTQEIREHARHLGEQVRRFDDLYAIVEPDLHAAQQAFKERDLEEADDILSSLPDVSDFPSLLSKLQTLQQQVARARKRQVQQQLHDALVKTQVALNLATEPEQLDATHGELVRLPLLLYWQALPEADQERYNQMLAHVRERYEALQAHEVWQADLQAAREQQDYEAAEYALQQMAQAAPDNRKRAEIQRELQRLGPLIERQRSQRMAVEAGITYLNQGDYAQARHEFQRAQHMGVAVDAWLNLARAGVLYQETARTWKETWNHAENQASLEKALHLVQASAETSDDAIQRKAREMRADLHAFQTFLEQQQQGLQARAEQIRATLTANDIETAEQQTRQLLSDYPGYPEALALEQHIQTRKLEHAARALLDQAAEAHSSHNHQRAQALLLAVLNMQGLPEHVRLHANSLQTEIAHTIQQQAAAAEALAARDRLLQAAQDYAAANDFVQAYHALREATAHGADPATVEDLYQQAQDREAMYIASVVEPIRDDLLRSGNLPEALRLCRQELERGASAPLQEELRELQDIIVTRWAEETCAAVQSQLEDAPDGPALLDSAARLHLLQNEVQPFLAGKQLQEIMRYRLRVAEHLRSDLALLQPALEQARAVVRSAEAAGFEPVRYEAARLESMLSQQLYEEVEQVNREKRATLQQQAQATRDACSRQSELVIGPARIRQLQDDLERDITLLQELPEETRSAAGGELQNLLDELQGMLSRFKKTHEAMERSEHALRAGNIKGANKHLLGLRVVPALQANYLQQRSLVESLLQAEHFQDYQQWRDALLAYRDVMRQHPDLAEVVENNVVRCRTRLTEYALSSARAALEAAPPDPKAAEALLAQAEMEDWLLSSASDEMVRLRIWVKSQELVAQAAALLIQQESSPEQAAALLKEARLLVSDADAAEIIAQWEHLTQVVRAWQAERFDEAETLITHLPAPLSEMPRVRQLRRALEQMRLVNEALAAAPPHAGAAVSAMQRALEAAAEEPAVQRLFHHLKSQMLNHLEAARQDGRYAEALAFGGELLRLDAADNLMAERIAGLHQERSSRLQQAIQQASEALEIYEVARAAQVLRYAEKVAAPEGSAHLVSLRQKLGQRSSIVQQADQWLDTADEQAGRWRDAMDAQMGEAQWNAAAAARHLLQAEQAVEYALKASSAAASYARVTRTREEMQRRFAALAQRLQQREQFNEALQLCKLALRLGFNEEPGTLQREISTRRAERLAQLHGEARHALEAWDTEAARPRLAQGLQLDPNDGELQQLETQRREMLKQASTIQHAMHLGWEALTRRDYAAACQSFDAIISTYTTFHEARFWRDYTRNLRDGVGAVEQEEFEHAVTPLEEAWQLVWTERAAVLPTVLGSSDYIREQRRQAAYMVQRLAQAAQQLAQHYAQYAEYVRQGDEDAQLAQLELVLQHKEAFLQLAQTTTRAPDDFQPQPPPAPARLADQAADGIEQHAHEKEQA